MEGRSTIPMIIDVERDLVGDLREKSDHYSFFGLYMQKNIQTAWEQVIKDREREAIKEVMQRHVDTKAWTEHSKARAVLICREK